MEKGNFLDILAPMFAKYSHAILRNFFESVFIFSSLIIIVEGNLALFVEFLESIMSFNYGLSLRRIPFIFLY